MKSCRSFLSAERGSSIHLISFMGMDHTLSPFFMSMKGEWMREGTVLFFLTIPAKRFKVRKMREGIHESFFFFCSLNWCGYYVGRFPFIEGGFTCVTSLIGIGRGRTSSPPSSTNDSPPSQRRATVRTRRRTILDWRLRNGATSGSNRGRKTSTFLPKISSLFLSTNSEWCSFFLLLKEVSTPLCSRSCELLHLFLF